MRGSERATVAIGAGLILAFASLVWRIELSLQWLSILLLIPGIAFAVLAAVGDRRAHRILAKADIDGVIGMGLVLGVSTFAISLFLALVPPAGVSWLVFGGVLVAVAALAGWIDRSASIVPFAALVVTLAAVLVMVISVMDSRGDSLDVMVFQSEGTEAILSGDNPYGIRFVNPYSPADSPTFYDPSLTEDGILLFGFPYPPASLAAVVPFAAAFGDFRLAQAAAYLMTALIIAAIHRAPRGRRIATVFLLASPLVYVVGFGWTEPLVMVAAALVVLAAVHRSSATPFLVGIAVSMKQYAALLLPVSLLLVERPWTARKVWTAMWPPLAVVAFTTIPFLLWGPSDFVQSVLRVQLVQPFRPDSLAFPALVAQLVGTPHSLAVTVLQGVAVVGTIVMCLRRSPVGPHGFALASALILVVLYATSKQAFPNYYSLAIGLLFLGASASLSHVEEADVDAEISETPIIESPSSTGR